jgi:hypothetical protein
MTEDLAADFVEDTGRLRSLLGVDITGGENEERFFCGASRRLLSSEAAPAREMVRVVITMQ